MITEAFLNSCFTVILDKDQKIPKTVYRDIGNIMAFHKKKEKDDIAIPLKNKLDCLEKACEMKLEDAPNDNIIDSLLAGEKYKPLADFIVSKLNEKVDEKEIKDIIKHIKTRIKLMDVFSNYDKVSDFIEVVKNGSFDTMDDIVFDYEILVKKMYANLRENSRDCEIESSSSLDLMDDDYASVIDKLKKKFDVTNVLPTGFSIFDNNVLRGGFEKTRLYIFAGGSGSGKSTIMTNCIENGLIIPRVTQEKQIYIYVTLENLIDETLMRMYQSIFQRTTPQFIYDINSNPINYVKDKIVQKINQSNSTVVLKYFPKFSISPTDIMMILDDVISQYKTENIRGLFVDYLDLLTIEGKFEAYRLELSHITSQLKDIAVAYNIPVITASQLNREVYTKNPNAQQLNMSMMSESIKKIEHADFIAIMSKDDTDDSLVHMKIGKNRGGAAGKTIDFKVDFSKYKFLNGFEVNNASEPTRTNDVVPFDISSTETQKFNAQFEENPEVSNKKRVSVLDSI